MTKELIRKYRTEVAMFQRKLTITTHHVSPEYCFDHSPITVSENHDGTWFANHAKLGCSKDYQTMRGAVFGLTSDHACVLLAIYDEKGERLDDSLEGM